MAVEKWELNVEGFYFPCLWLQNAGALQLLEISVLPVAGVVEL